MTKTRVVGVNISLESTTTAVVDVRGNVIAKDDFPTGDNPNVGDFASRLSENIVNLVEANGGYESIRSVGICCPSANFLTGCIENAPNLPWKGVVPLAAMMRDRMGLAVALGNNAHVRALGEQAYGLAHGMKDFILITLGSGMGSCIFSNGQPHLGRSGFAGEIGHTCAKQGGRLCGCGNRGCLEMYTSRRGIVQTAKELMAESSEPSKMRDVEALSADIVSALCNEGDVLALEVMRRTGYMLGVGLANYASMVNPEAIIFTGKVARYGDCLLNPAIDAFNSHVFHNVEGKVKFLLSHFDESEANLLGASVLAWNVKEYSLFK
jgi:glucokinase